MADKRKPTLAILLRYQGNKNAKKIELFDSSLFKGGYFHGSKSPHFRIRVNGKWWNDKDGKIIFVTKTAFKNIFSRSLKLK